MAFQRDNLKQCLTEFNNINRYYDPVNKVDAAKILPGEFYVSLHGEMIATVLGSCVSACIRDPIAKIGGMNHFMLPIDNKNVGKELSEAELSVASRYGDFAMEKLINVIISNGGKRKNLEVKVFGGGRVVSQLHSSDVGERNIEFVKEYLHYEGLKIVAQDTGDIYPRKVHYYSDTGKVLIKKLHVIKNPTITDREDQYFSKITKKPEQSEELELFQ